MNGRTAKLLRRYALLLDGTQGRYRAMKRYWTMYKTPKQRAKDRRRIQVLLRAHGLMV